MNVYLPFTVRLPSAYQEVEWIETTGTQFINTGLFPGNNIQTETKIELTTTDQNIPVFGCYGSSINYRSGNYYHLTPYSSKWYFGLNGSEGNGGTYSPTAGTQYTIVYNNSNNYLNVNGTNIVSVSGTAGMSGTTLSISLRSDKEGGSIHNFRGKYKYFYFKMYNKTTGEYERDFVPCYRKSDNVIGMYDLVNSVFYTNAGTGTFSKGNDVTTSELKNAYIGEVYEYSYDFRNKTVQNLTDDGWTNVSSATVNVNGITFSGWTAILNQPSGLQAKMDNAERLVLTYTMNYSSTSGSTAGLTLVNSDQSTGQTGLYIDSYYYEALINNSSFMHNSHGSISGDFTNTIDYDFVNKQCSVSFPGIYTNTFSITDAQISAIRNLTYIKCPVNYSYLKTISVEVY